MSARVAGAGEAVAVNEEGPVESRGWVEEGDGDSVPESRREVKGGEPAPSASAVMLDWGGTIQEGDVVIFPRVAEETDASSGCGEATAVVAGGVVVVDLDLA